MATSSDVVKQGYVKVKSKHIGVWKKRWLKLRRESLNGPVRIEKFSDEASSMIHGGERAVTELTQLLCLNRLHDDVKKHGIFIAIGVYPDVQKLQFCTDSEMEADNWMKALLQESTRAETVDGERNDIFWVYLMRAKQFDSHGECLFQVTSDSLSLLDIENPKRVLVTWPLKAIRRYGVERGVFTIESGRSCTTGEGNFYFDARDADLIHRKVHEATQELANPRPKKVNNVAKENAMRSPNYYDEYSTPGTDYDSVRNSTQLNNNTRRCKQKSIEQFDKDGRAVNNDYYLVKGANGRKVSDSMNSPSANNAPGMSYEEVQYEQKKSDLVRGATADPPVRKSSQRSTSSTVPENRPPSPPGFYRGMEQMRVDSYAYRTDEYLLEKRAHDDRFETDSCYTATGTYAEIKSNRSAR